jgi:hypothetical protein
VFGGLEEGVKTVERGGWEGGEKGARPGKKMRRREGEYWTHWRKGGSISDQRKGAKGGHLSDGDTRVYQTHHQPSMRPTGHCPPF